MQSKRLTFLCCFIFAAKIYTIEYLSVKLNFKCFYIYRLPKNMCVKMSIIYYHISTHNIKSALPSIEMVNGFLCLTICLDTRYGIKQTSTNKTHTHTHRHDLKDFISILPPNNRFQFHPTLKTKFTNKALFQTLKPRRDIFIIEFNQNAYTQHNVAFHHLTEKDGKIHKSIKDLVD